MRMRSLILLILLIGAAAILAGCPGKGKMMKGSLDNQVRQVESIG